MKTTVALFFALVILLPHSANAETLTITFGGAVLNQEVGPRGQGSRIRFAGDDFSVLYGQEESFDLSRAFGVEPFVQSIAFSLETYRGFIEVQVGTQICHGSEFDACGDITGNHCVSVAIYSRACFRPLASKLIDLSPQIETF